MKRVLVTMLAAMTGFVLAAGPLALGADDKAPVPTGEKKAGKKAGGKKAEASGAEGKAQAGTAGPLTVQDKVAKMQRLRKLVQAGNMVVLEKVIENCFQLGDPARDRDLLALASFFRAGLFGKSGDEAKCWEWMEKAIGYGFLSASGFEDLSLIPDSFKQTAKFKERMEKLRTDAEILVEEEFQKDVLAGISNPARRPSSFPKATGSASDPILSIRRS